MPRNPNGRKICCEGCGRDTNSRSGFCFACTGKKFDIGNPAADIRDLRIDAGAPDLSDDEFDDEFVPRKGDVR